MLLTLQYLEQPLEVTASCQDVPHKYEDVGSGIAYLMGAMYRWVL